MRFDVVAHSTLKLLASEMDKAIAEGWQPHGPIITLPGDYAGQPGLCFVQAVVLYEDVLELGALRDAARALIDELMERTHTTSTDPHPQASFVGGRVCSIETLMALKEMCEE